MIQTIIEAMKHEIAKYNLELLQRHAKDLDIDMAMLERFASPGLRYAWMVGCWRRPKTDPPIAVVPTQN